MKLKVLPLSPTMDLDFYDDDDKFMFFNFFKGSEIHPVFNRPGIYKYGKLCWFETCWFKTHILAYKYSLDQFDYALNIFNISELNINQYKALKDIVKQKLSTKKQKEMMFLYEDWLKLKEIKRGSKKYFKK